MTRDPFLRDRVQCHRIKQLNDILRISSNWLCSKYLLQGITSKS